jgi:prefoldin subunit 5
MAENNNPVEKASVCWKIIIGEISTIDMEISKLRSKLSELESHKSRLRSLRNEYNEIAIANM